MACFGTFLSTVIVGLAMWEVGKLLAFPLSLPWALVFGALISPTDPVAVMATLRNVTIPASLKVEMQGESLFNNGVDVATYGSTTPW